MQLVQAALTRYPFTVICTNPPPPHELVQTTSKNDTVIVDCGVYWRCSHADIWRRRAQPSRQERLGWDNVLHLTGCKTMQV